MDIQLEKKKGIQKKHIRRSCRSSSVNLDYLRQPCFYAESRSLIAQHSRRDLWQVQ